MLAEWERQHILELRKLGIRREHVLHLASGVILIWRQNFDAGKHPGPQAGAVPEEHRRILRKVRQANTSS